MIARLAHTTVAWTLAVVALFVAFWGSLPGPDLSLWQLHVIAAIVCGCSAAACIAWRRPYLYGLLVVVALLIPMGGPVLVLVLGHLAKRELPEEPKSDLDPFVCGVPLRESNRAVFHGQTASFISNYVSMENHHLDAVLGGIVKLEEAPLMSLNRKFRDHPDTRVRLVGQACVADRLNELERRVRELERRIVHDGSEIDAALGLCETHLAVLEQRLLQPRECTMRAHAGLEAVRRLVVASDGGSLDGAIAFYEAQFALHLGERERAVGAWAQLVEIMEKRAVARPVDRFHLLGAEVSLSRGDLTAVREHIRKLEPDTPSKFWLQEFWLEPAPMEAS